MLRFFTVLKCRIRPFLHKKNHYFRKEFLDKTIFHSFRTFAHIRQNYFSKYWGINAWAVPHLKFWGDRLPSPPRSPPLSSVGVNVGQHKQYLAVCSSIGVLKSHDCQTALISNRFE